MAEREFSDNSDELSGSEDDDSEDPEDERPIKEPRKDAVYNMEGLHDKLQEIWWPEDVDWIHTLRLGYSGDVSGLDVNDDLSREMSFYSQGLDGAKEAYLKLQAMGIPFLRPSDYYAEMVKTDSQMLKIKDKLLHEHKQLEEVNERRKQREAKKFSKQVQAEKIKDRNQQKKEAIESVKKWRKNRKKSDYADNEDGPLVDFEGEGPPAKKRKIFGAPGDRSGGKGRGGSTITKEGRGRESGRGGRGRESGRGGRGSESGRGGRGRESGRGGREGVLNGRSSPSAGKSRGFRDSKFGFGGKKSKRNTAESSADDSSFRGGSRGRGRGRGTGRGRGRGRRS